MGKNVIGGKMKKYKRPEPDPYQPEFINCEFCGCYTNAKLRRCCDSGYRADGGKWSND